MVWDITTSILTSHGFLDLSDPSPDVSKLLRTHFTRAHTVTALQMWIGYKQNESASYEGTQKSEPGSIGTSKAVQVACTCIFPSKNFASYILMNHASWAILISDCGIIYHAPFKSLSGLNAASELYCRGPWQGFHFFTKSSPPKLGHPNMRRQLRRHHHHKPGSSQNNCRCGNYASTAHKDSIHEDSGDKPGGLTKYLGLRILNASNPNISKN